jgi:hypothetical protein
MIREKRHPIEGRLAIALFIFGWRSEVLTWMEFLQAPASKCCHTEGDQQGHDNYCLVIGYFGETQRHAGDNPDRYEGNEASPEISYISASVRHPRLGRPPPVIHPPK